MTKVILQHDAGHLIVPILSSSWALNIGNAPSA